MTYYLNFNELSCSAKEDLIDHVIEDYIRRYGVDDIHNELMESELDYDDIIFMKALEHMPTLDIAIKL